MVTTCGQDPDSTIRVLCSRAKVPEVNEVRTTKGLYSRFLFSR